MAQVMNTRITWRAAWDWVEKRQESADDDGVVVVTEILDVLRHLPWDVSLKGFGAEASLRSSELTSLLANSKINGRVIDALVAAAAHKHMLSDPENCARLAIESLSLSTALRCDASRWKEYATHKAFKHLRYIGDCLCDGTLQRVIFPINIANLHWAVFEVDASQQEIRYGDSLDWTCPSADIDAIHCWLKQHGFGPFRKALTMPHGAQYDSYSCGVAALNTIHHAVSQTPLFSDDAKDILRMEEFLILAYSHLEKSEVSLDQLVVIMILIVLWTAPRRNK